MKNPRFPRLALSLGLLGTALLASPVSLNAADFESLRAKADRGNAIAQYNLGLAYADRREPAYDPVQAYAWLSLAASNGTTGKALSTVTSLLTAEQLAEGKRRLAALTSPVSPIAAPASPIMAVEEPAAPPRSAAPATSAPAVTAEPEQDQKKLSAELAAAWKENELLKSGLTAQLADANKRIAIAEAALASKDKEIGSLQTRLSEAAKTSTVPVGLSAELASVRAERDQLQATVTAANTELAELRTASANASAEQAVLRGKLARAATELADARRAQVLAEAESSSLKAAADRASAERLAVAAQLETATTELAAAKAAPKPVETISETDLAALKADRERLADTVKTLEQDRNALSAQLATAKAAATTPEVVASPAVVTPDTAAADRVAELEKTKAETDTKLAAALRSFTLQQTEIDRLQKSLASIDAERAATSAKLDTATTELNALRPQAAASATRSKETESLSAQLTAANQSLAEKSSALATANSSLADARKTIDSATAELVATRDQLRQTQAQSAASAVEAQQLKTRLALVGNLPAGTSPSRPTAIPSVSIDLPAATAPAVAASATPSITKAEAPTGPRSHIVGAGDSLSRISKQYYGTSARWNDILQANKDVIRNPDALTLGTKLRIP